MYSAQKIHDGQLIPTALDSLSPHHAAVFLFGCQVMQLLENCSLFPSVLLLLAKSIPVSSSACNEAMLAHCSGDFYFDETNQILYLSEAKLQHVGHFIAIILQSMAHIASGNGGVFIYNTVNPILCPPFQLSINSSVLGLWLHTHVSIVLPSGSKPQAFMHALHEAVSALGLASFNLSFHLNAAKVIICLNNKQTTKSPVSAQVGLKIFFIILFDSVTYKPGRWVSQRLSQPQTSL